MMFFFQDFRQSPIGSMAENGTQVPDKQMMSMLYPITWKSAAFGTSDPNEAYLYVCMLGCSRKKTFFHKLIDQTRHASALRLV